MARRCELTDTGVLTGNNVSHAKNRTRGVFCLTYKTLAFTAMP